MKITGAVRVIKGQEVLPEGSTLDEHGITDGSTVNIVIEPDKEINLKMKLGSRQFTHKVLNSVRVRELKQQLIDCGNVGFKHNAFTLLISADDNNEIAGDIFVLDESLPLHIYRMGDNTTIRIIGGRVQIILVASRGLRWLKTFPRSISISQMKQRIRRFLGDDKDLDDIWLFKQINKSYRRLDDDDDGDEPPIGSVLSDTDVIYLVEDRFISVDTIDMFPVYHKGEEVGRVWWKITTDEVYSNVHYNSDTVLNLKLRIQELLGFPVSRVDVKVRGQSMENNQLLYHVNLATEFRIEVV